MDLRVEAPNTIILAHQRSGTHFLLSLLASHPRIHGRGEWILHYKRRLARNELDVPNPVERYRRIFRNYPGFVNVGILMYSQVPVFEELCGPLVNHRVIHLLRNPSAVAKSAAQMRANRASLGPEFRAHYEQGENVPKQAIYSPEIEAEIESRVISLQKQYTANLEKSTMLFTLRYEDITGGCQVNQLQSPITNALLEFLGVEPLSLSTNLVKTGATRAPGDSHE